ncbi:MAG: response regulator transcription factor [Vicinamibacterales bacterium]
MRLLVVEDDAKLATTLRERLTKAQYVTDVATDGNEALDFTSTTTYDAVILDVMLPGVDGLSVCRRLRAKGAVTPILLLTARDSEMDKIAGLDSGADDYVTKPFGFGELLARLRALLRREATRKEAVFRFSDLALDPSSQAVYWADRSIELTAREYRILETLVRRPTWVVSKDAIIESVWGFGFSDSSNLVEVYIRRLRRKLEEHGAPPLIQTVRGAGYRLVEQEL